MTNAKNVWTVGPDTEIEELISEEKKRQETSLQLIASENFASPAVMKATVRATHGVVTTEVMRK